MVNTTSSFVKVSYVPATKVHDAVALTVSGGATPSATSSAVDIAGVKYLTISVLNGNSTNLDMLVYASYDGTNFDTLPYASLNAGASAKKTLNVMPGPAYIKIKIQNNDASNTTITTVGINLTY